MPLCASPQHVCAEFSPQHEPPQHAAPSPHSSSVVHPALHPLSTEATRSGEVLVSMHTTPTTINAHAPFSRLTREA